VSIVSVGGVVSVGSASNDVDAKEAPVQQPALAEGAAHTSTPPALPLELGATTFLLAGVGTSGVVGLSAFVDAPLSSDVFLRISASGGRAPTGDLSTTWAAARLDTCYSVAGNYAAGQGLRLALCGGADVGLTLLGAGSQTGAPQGSQTMPFVDLGPSVELGAELGPKVTVVLRGALGVNIARDTFVDGSGARIDPALGTERAEVGLSFKLP
jgi:hypothetical protein